MNTANFMKRVRPMLNKKQKKIKEKLQSSRLTCSL